MFETAELGRKLSKDAFAKIVPQLRTDLLRVQNELRLSERFSVIIVIAGVDGAGKGETVNLLHQWMDPRFLETHAFGPRTEEERERPLMWRFWRVLPPKGKIGMFFGSWYTAPILQRVYGKITQDELEAALVHINNFENQLSENGTLLLKFWFHLSKKAQKKRLKTLSGDPKLSWRVTDRDWKHFEMYDEFTRVSERAIRVTSTGKASWSIVEGADPNYRHVTVGQHLLKAIEQRAQAQALEAPLPSAPLPSAPLPSAPLPSAPLPSALSAPPAPEDHQPTILSTVDLSKTIAKSEYHEQLEEYQGKLNLLSRKMQERGVSAVLVFEGWDAAGKGGVIRRVTPALDARSYSIVPVGAPTDEEKARHYLWRFWRHLPRAGRITMFDRSWYGRVLVERVEGLATEDVWARAFKEINEFEDLLREHGMAVVKFWLHISKDEQLRRFEAREQTPHKQFKITAEDYRNREKWIDYEQAVNEMVERTSTATAPWTIVESNDKRHARIKVLRSCCEQIADAVEQAKRSSK